MLAAALLLQTSSLLSPIYLQEDPPEMRAMRMILVAHVDVPGARDVVDRTQEEARVLAADLAQRLEQGADFTELARTWSNHPSAKHGGAMGVFWPGMLGDEADEFLFAAELHQLSGSVETLGGILLLQRQEVEAGCLQIMINGTGVAERDRAQALMDQLAEGADFATLAREHSEESLSAARGGQFRIFVRGRSDRLVKEAVFGAQVGETVGPFASPMGWHIVRRVPAAELDPALRENVVARVRAIVIGRRGGDKMPREVVRLDAEARSIAEDYFHRIQVGGEDMGDLAAQLNDDEGGLERRGDLGWVLRGVSRYTQVVSPVFMRPVGDLIGPLDTTAGWALVLREQ